MENRNLLATVLLVLTGITYNTASRPQSSPAPGSVSKGASQPHSGEDKKLEPWNAIADFESERSDDGKRPVPEFLIATVPDPVDTHLSIFFDRGIESIVYAAGTARYGFDSYWIPWRDNPFSSTPSPDVLSAQELTMQAREQEPGVLLFRAEPDTPEAQGKQAEPGKQGNNNDRADLVVFLIGETPTGGINTSQFRKAVEFIQAITADGKRSASRLKPAPSGRFDEIRVMGTNFSGSLASLAAAIQASSKGWRFNVVSGSTTADSSIHTFQKELAKLSLPGTFKTTIHSDHDATCAFFERLREESGNGIKVAILSEGDTAFGAAARDEKKDPCDNNIDLVSLPFPRDIARLRNAYREEALIAPVSTANGAAPREGISLTLKDSNGGHDSVPSFSQQTQVSQDSVLQSIAAVLRREEIQYAAIYATDPLDTLFLARYLSANAPNIRLFQMDSDLLFVRPPDSLPLAGMLSVTTYPLIVRNQYWTGEETGRLVFASRYSQGIFNATAWLLGNRDLLEYTSPWTGGSVPPLWLTAAGRSGYWPVALFLEGEPCTNRNMVCTAGAPAPSDPNAARKPAAAGDPLAEEPSHLYIILVCAVGLVALAMLAGLLLSTKSSANWLSDFKFGGDKSGRTPYVLVCVLALLALALCLTGPFWRLFSISSWALYAASLLPSVPLVVSAMILTFRGFRNHRLLTTAVWLGFAAVVWVGYRLLTAGQYHEDFFFAYRALNISSGLSPSLPVIFLLAAYAVWGRVHWQRRILLEERLERLPRIDGPKEPWKDHAGEKPRADRSPMSVAANAIGNVFAVLSGKRIGAVSLIIGCIVFVVLRPHLHTPEHAPYGWLYEVALALLCSLIALTASQFLLGWFRLERLLTQVEFHPIRFALSDLPPDRSLSPIWQSGIGKRSYVLLTRSVDCLRTLIHEEPEPVPPLKERLGGLEEPTRTLIENMSAGQRASGAQIQAMEEAVGTAEYLAAVLWKVYWRRGSSESVPTAKAAGAERPYRLAAEFVALRFVAYIRYVMLHLRNLLGFLTTAFLLVVISLNSYPFQAPEVIGAFIVMLFAALSAMVLWVFLRMNANPALKRITTVPGQEKRDFSIWIRLLETGGLPLLAVIASNIPGAGQYLFSWIGPLMDRLH